MHNRLHGSMKSAVRESKNTTPNSYERVCNWGTEQAGNPAKTARIAGKTAGEPAPGATPSIPDDSVAYALRCTPAHQSPPIHGSLFLNDLADALERRARYLREASRSSGVVDPRPVDPEAFLVQLEEHGWSFPPAGILDGSVQLYTPPPGQRNLDREEAAGYLGVHPDGIARLVTAGVLRGRPRWSVYALTDLDDALGRIVARFVARYPLTYQEHLACMSTPPPEARPSGAHLYAIEIPTVGTKVGITARPEQRLASHAHAAKVHKRRLGRVWISYRHEEASQNEALLVGRSKTEYLRSPFDRVMTRIETLPMTRCRHA